VNNSTPPAEHLPLQIFIKEPPGLLHVPIDGPTPNSVPLIVKIKYQREVYHAGQCYDFAPGQIVVDWTLLWQITNGAARFYEPDEMTIVKTFAVEFGIIAWYIPEHAT